MKKIITLAAVLAAISTVSCTKEKSSAGSCPLPSATGVACISAQPDYLAVGTKTLSSYSVLESRDLKIDCYNIAFFNGTTLVREVSVSNAGITDGQIPQTTVTLPVGTYKVYLAANAYTSFEDLQILNSTPGAALGQYRRGTDPELILWDLCNDAYDDDGNLVQVASGTISVTEGSTLTSAATASLQLKRKVARVRVNSISNRLPSGMEVELEAVYLSNVCVRDLLFSSSDFMSTYNRYFFSNLDGRYYYGEDPSTGLPVSTVIGESYYNNSADRAAAVSSDISYKGIVGVLAGGASYSTPFNLYCYRNSGSAYGTGDSDVWEIRDENLIEWYGGTAAPATQLVIAAGLGHNLDDPESARTMVYYPIKLAELFPGGVKPNYSYNLDITLNSVGSSNPSEHISYGVAGVVASVAGWNDGGVSTVEM